jgi:hypothetical protein
MEAQGLHAVAQIVLLRTWIETGNHRILFRPRKVIFHLDCYLGVAFVQWRKAGVAACEDARHCDEELPSASVHSWVDLTLDKRSQPRNLRASVEVRRVRAITCVHVHRYVGERGADPLNGWRARVAGIAPSTCR